MSEIKRRKFTYAWLAKNDAYLSDPLFHEYVRETCPTGPETKARVQFLLSQDSAEKLHAFVLKRKFDNPVAASDYHMTVVHSGKKLPNYERNINVVVSARDTELTILSIAESDTLILRVMSDVIQKRRESIMRKLGITAPRRMSYISLSASPGSIDRSKLRKIKINFDLIFRRKRSLVDVQANLRNEARQ